MNFDPVAHGADADDGELWWRPGRVVGELARISGDCGLRPPAELTMLGKALLNLDQVADKLDPDFDPQCRDPGARGRDHAP